MNERLEVLRNLLAEGKLSTQDELRMKLENMKFRVTQSTISRDLRRIGAVRAIDANGNTVYRLPGGAGAEVAPDSDIVRNVQANNSMIVIHTVPGAASMVARQIDFLRSPSFIGTIAGDDTVFVALSSKITAEAAMREIEALVDDLE